jgi:hypothetical protein
MTVSQFITDQPRTLFGQLIKDFKFDLNLEDSEGHTALSIALFAHNVPAEIRLRFIKTNIENTENIIQQWDNANKINENLSYQLSRNTYNKITNKQIKSIVNNSLQWRPYMNLYTHNCQHFSHYVKNISRPFSIGNN